MNLARAILRAANALVSLAVAVCLTVSGAYACYALWDNQQVYSAAENVQLEMQKLKPKVEQTTDQADAPAEPAPPSFDELLAVNEDVCAWLTIDNTKIDYPVLQGETNLDYINTDVYGNFALAGSIFLDSRNDRTFADRYSLLYGHHMEGGRMFGDLDLFKDEKFFNDNRSGTLMLPERVCTLKIFACLVAPASEENIFQPTLWTTDIDRFIEYARTEALFIDDEMIETTLHEAENPERVKVLTMSTCSSEYTDARTIVLAFILEDEPQSTGRMVD